MHLRAARYVTTRITSVIHGHSVNRKSIGAEGGPGWKREGRKSVSAARFKALICASVRAISPLIPAFPWMVLDTTLLSDAKGAEDQVEDVVGGGDAGDFVERAEGSVEVEEKHLVGDAGGHGVGRVVERGECVAD